MQYVFFDEQGRITQVSSNVTEQEAAATCGHTGYSCIAHEDHVEADTHYIHLGGVHPKGERPSYHHIFDHAQRKWVDIRSLDDIMAAKKMAINKARDAACSGSFMFDGKEISLDSKSVSAIERANGHAMLTGALPAGWPGGWKSADNTYVAINDQKEWVAFYSAMVSHCTAAFNKANDLKARVEQASTPSDLLAIPDWE